MRRRRLGSMVSSTLLGLATTLLGATAGADTLSSPRSVGDRSYSVLEELSYELLLVPDPRGGAELKIRTTLHNHSSVSQEGVMTLAAPGRATLVGLRSAQDGQWNEGLASQLGGEGEGANGGQVPVGQRDAGNVYARVLPRASPKDALGVEVSVWGLAPSSTVQIELVFAIRPELRANRWMVDLPRRNAYESHLASERRLLMPGTPEFWVDGVPNQGDPVMQSPAENNVRVSWPTDAVRLPRLDAHLVASRERDLELELRLGPGSRIQAQHLAMLIDASESTTPTIARSAKPLTENLLAGLGPNAELDLLAFDRSSRALAEGSLKSAAIPAALARLKPRLQERGQGSDPSGAIREALTRAENRSGKTLVVVLTDGAFPQRLAEPESLVALRQLAEEFREKTILVFGIVDPVLETTGKADQAVLATVAEALGARVAVLRANEAGRSGAQDLMTAPPVLSRLRLGLPPGVDLDAPPPVLVAGQTVRLRGTWKGKWPSSISVRGRRVGQSVRVRAKAVRPPKSAEAFASAFSQEVGTAAEEGFVLPAWYSRRESREAALRLATAGRHGDELAGTLDSEILHRYLRQRVLPRARACFNGALARWPVQGGEVELEIEVGRGEVADARVAEIQLVHPDPRFEACLDQAAWSMRAPAGKLDPQAYLIRYPLQLSPPKSGRAPVTREGPDPAFELLLRAAGTLARTGAR